MPINGVNVYLSGHVKRKVKTSTIVVMSAIVMLLLLGIKLHKHCRQKIMSNKRDKPKKNSGYLYTHTKKE